MLILFLMFYFILIPCCYIAGVKGNKVGDVYYSEGNTYKLKLPLRGWVSQYESETVPEVDLRIVNPKVDGEILIISFEIKEMFKDIKPESTAMNYLRRLEFDGVLNAISKFENMEVDGYPAKKINFSGPLKKGTLITFKRGLYIYQFLFIISSIYFEEQEPIFYEVVKSFDFLR